MSDTVQIGKIMGLSLGVIILSSCTQMTKHSNTLVFGTDSVIGAKVGQDANQLPTIDLGYTRREVALVPLLANTKVGSDGDLEPCPATSTSVGTNVTINMQDCHFRATNGGVDQDSYSTLASFGAEVKGSGSEASMAIAQFFATGVAAQQLALSGGANLVQVSSSEDVAKENASAAARAQSLVRGEEINNAAIYSDNIEQGKIVAKSIMGGASTPVTDTEIQALVAEIAKVNSAGCAASDFDSYSKVSVDRFLEDMEEMRFQCLQRLGVLINQ